MPNWSDETSDFLAPLASLEQASMPHCDDDPATGAVHQAAIGLRRLLEGQPNDGVSGLLSAVDKARAVRATVLGGLDELTAKDFRKSVVSSEHAAIERIELTVTADSRIHHLALDWEGGQSQEPVLRIGDREITDPIEHQRLTHALEVFSKAAEISIEQDRIMEAGFQAQVGEPGGPQARCRSCETDLWGEDDLTVPCPNCGEDPTKA